MTTLTDVWGWVTSHPYIVGSVAAQLVMFLPDGRMKDVLSRLLHGLFASPQVVLGGSAPKSPPRPPGPPAVPDNQDTHETILPPPPNAARNVLTVGVGAVLLYFVSGGCAAAPTPAQQASVATYEAALQGCILTAKADDSGLAGYEKCAAGVDKTFRGSP